jgi:hypothetical protein
VIGKSKSLKHGGTEAAEEGRSGEQASEDLVISKSKDGWEIAVIAHDRRDRKSKSLKQGGTEEAGEQDRGEQASEGLVLSKNEDG